MFEELNEDKYDARQAKHNNDDFIVDDDGFGYKDDGGEIWDRPDDADNAQGGKKKRKKIEEGSIETFMFASNKKKSTTSKALQ